MKKEENKILTPIKAIRAKCLDCSNYQYSEVKLCTVTNCSLYPYRMGKRPKKGYWQYKRSIALQKLIIHKIAYDILY